MHWPPLHVLPPWDSQNRTKSKWPSNPYYNLCSCLAEDGKFYATLVAGAIRTYGMVYPMVSTFGHG